MITLSYPFSTPFAKMPLTYLLFESTRSLCAHRADLLVVLQYDCAGLSKRNMLTLSEQQRTAQRVEPFGIVVVQQSKHLIFTSIASVN